MYSNYLCEVSKLVYIIGTNEKPILSFKKLLQSNIQSKSKYFFKFVEELPTGSYQKIKIDCKKGILRCDWFNKILDRSALMIFMVFNYCQQLEINQKWQDRLQMTIKKINKVAHTLKSYNKEETILKVIVILSKEAVLASGQTGQNINVTQKINNYLKSYEKQLSIYQYDTLERQITKNKGSWMSMLQKAYERKYRTISKRKDEGFGQRKLGCLIKMAIISQIINKRDSCYQYTQAYKALSQKFMEVADSKNIVQNLDYIRELRTLADIILLRKLIVDVYISSNFSTTPDVISSHLRIFSQNVQNNPMLYSYLNAIWRQNFLQNLLQVLYKNDNVEILSKNYYAQLINTAISLSYQLCRADKQLKQYFQQLIKINPQIKPKLPQQYIGRTNYQKLSAISDDDIIKIQINDLLQKKKDYISRGLQTITRYKNMKIYKKYQTNFFNIYLLRFYLVEEKIGSIDNVFKEIVKIKIGECDYYLINYLIEELKKQAEKSDEHQILIQSLALLIADYFQNQQQLEKYGLLFIDSLTNREVTQLIDIDVLENAGENQTQKDPLILPLTSQSSIFEVGVELKNEMHMIEQPLQIVVVPKINCKFLTTFTGKTVLMLYFNKKEILFEIQLDLQNINKENSKITMTIDPLQYFSKDETLQLSKAVLILKTNPEVHFLINKIEFSKCKSVMLISKLSPPEINIVFPYTTYYLKQTSKFLIEVGNVDKSVKMEINFTIKEESKNNTEVFMDKSECVNLVNSHRNIALSSTSANIIYLRCNQVGQRVLKFVFDVNSTQQIGSKQLKNHHTIVKEMSFKVGRMFNTSKVLKQAFTGLELHQNEIPPNKNIIMSYSFSVNETINIIEFGSCKRDKPYFKTKKDIQTMSNFIINPEETIKNVYMFEIKEEQLNKDEKKTLVLISFYTKWNRIGMDNKFGICDEQEIENLYNEDQIQISLKSSKVEIQLEEGKVLKKRQKETLSIKYRNLTNDKIHVDSSMENSDAILRIGSKGREIDLEPRETKTITFQILPIKSGYSKYPDVRSYYDGIEGKQKPCSSIIFVE